MYCELFTILDSDVLLLTANLRLTEYLIRDYTLLQQEKGLSAWHTPNILPLNTWISQLWQHHPETEGLLLSEFEENLLWQDTITQDEQTKQVLQVNQAVSLAKSAWHTLQQWQIDLTELDHNTNAEVAKFISLAQQFEDYKNKHKLFTQVELFKIVAHLINTGKVSPPKLIILYGFDQLPPAAETLIKTLQTKSNVKHFHLHNQNQTIAKAAFHDEEAEITAMALWAKQNLASLTPREKIGCIIPKLRQNRDKIINLFTEVFAPDNIIPGQKMRPLPFNISAGLNLNNYPLVKTALQILSLNNDVLDHDLVKDVLLSPYVNSNEDERALGAISATTLNNNQHCLLTHKKVLAQINQLSQTYYPEATLPQRWQQLSQCAADSEKQSFTCWVQFAQTRLQACGWPGQKPLASPEFQIMQRFQQALSELIKLDRVLNPVSYTRFLQVLRELTQQIIFQPQSEDKPIQILGVLEAMGCRFRHLWLMGLDDEAWPDKANPNPFLPIDLQRKLHMPHSSAERELEFSRNIQGFLIEASNEAVLSYATQEDDKTQNPSRLIEAFTPKEFDFKIPNHPDANLNFESIADFKAKPVEADENIRGGSWIIKTQSICPFRAFGTIRLLAKPPEKITLGLSGQVRGILTHFTLETLWKQIKTQENLIQLNNEKLDNLIAQSIQEAITATNVHESKYREIERIRLTELLNQWITAEKNRPAFKVIEQESTRFLKIGTLPIRIQIDRIDELSDGSQLIVDYKTGKVNSISHWFGDRPRDPQLPLYFIYGSEKNIGLAYAEVNLASLQFKGLIDSTETFSKVTNKNKNLTSWHEVTQTWQQNITTLADEFMQGIATPKPLDPTDCNFCHLQSLCRKEMCS